MDSTFQFSIQQPIGSITSLRHRDPSSMKLVAITSAAALVAVTVADPCDVASLSKLLTSEATTTCGTASGYAVTSLTPPTEEQLVIMCSNDACQSVISQIETIAPVECTLGKFALYADLLTPLTDFCKYGSSPDTNVAQMKNSSATDGKISVTHDSPPTLTFANVTDSDEATVTPTKSLIDPSLTSKDSSADPFLTPTSLDDDPTVFPSKSSKKPTATPTTPSTDATTKTPSTHQNSTLGTESASEDLTTSQDLPSSQSQDDASSSLDSDPTQESSSASFAAISTAVVLAAVVVPFF